MNIGSFNIQNISLTKISNKFILDSIIKIILKYDILFILEVCGNKQEAIQLFDIIISKLNKKYKYFLSNKTGKTSSSAEYICCLYLDNLILTPIQLSLIDNSILTLFDRLPFIAKININDYNIIFIVNHISPKNVLTELNALSDLFDSIYDINNYYILIGDYNAGGTFLNNKEQKSCKLFQNKNLSLLSDNEITNLGKKSENYDRIFCSNNTINILNKIDDNEIGLNSYCDVDNYYNRVDIICSAESIKKLFNQYNNINQLNLIQYLKTSKIFLKKINQTNQILESINLEEDIEKNIINSLNTIKQIVLKKCKLISDHFPIYCQLKL